MVNVVTPLARIEQTHSLLIRKLDALRAEAGTCSSFRLKAIDDFLRKLEVALAAHP